MLFCRWEDRREVCMINSFMNHEMINSESSNPNNTRNKPKSVLLYNSKMGGVDDVDKITKPNKSIRKTIKWYKKVFFHLWDHALYNSFVTYKALHPTSKQRYKSFVECVVEEVLKQFPSIPAKLGRPTRRVIPNNRITGAHLPIQIPKRNGKFSKGKCKLCAQSQKVRSTSYKCECCDLWLCIKGINSCFKQYHNEKTLSKKKQSTTVIQGDKNQASEDRENFDDEPLPGYMVIEENEANYRPHNIDN